MNLAKAWDTTHGQKVAFKGSYYSISELIDMSEDLEVFTAPLEAFAMDYNAPCNNTFMDFARHVKQVNVAQTKFAIILSPCGVILDGRHRLAKCLVSGEQTIKFKRLTEMPDPIGSVDDVD